MAYLTNQKSSTTQSNDSRDEQFLYPLLPKTAKQKAEEERKKAGEQQQKAEEQQQVAEEQQLRALLRRQEIKEARELQAAEAARGRQVIADREAQVLCHRRALLQSKFHFVHCRKCIFRSSLEAQSVPAVMHASVWKGWRSPQVPSLIF
eukprot:401003-Pelagomonas_calceolata.AAC.1